jgi:hypothetical protein
MPVIYVISHDHARHAPDRETGRTGVIDPIFGERERRYVRLSRGAPLEDVVRQILGARAPGEKIARLCLLSHGDSGQVCLPGRDEDPLQFLTLSTVDVFAPLWPHFCTLRPRIEIHVSGVASDTPVLRNGRPVPGTWKGDGTGAGYRFMRRLAEVTDATVCGYLDFGLNPPRPAGRTVLIYPDGEFTRV